jgi:hypothetical protein
VEQFARENKHTYFVHSKTAITNALTETLKSVFNAVKVDSSASEFQGISGKLMKGLRTGSMDKNSAVFQLCLHLKNELRRFEEACKSVLNRP